MHGLMNQLQLRWQSGKPPLDDFLGCTFENTESSMKPKLTIKTLQEAAAKFAEIETSYNEPSLYGVTDRGFNTLELFKKPVLFWV